MARHRNVKNLNYDEEYYDAVEEEVYGTSFDDDSFLSTSMEKYLHKPGSKGDGLSAYMAEANIQEEDEYSDMEDEMGSIRDRRDSQSFVRPRLSSENEARLNSVLDSLRDIVGETFTDSVLIKTVLAHDYDQESSLDALFKLDEKPKQASRPSKQAKKSQKKKSAGSRVVNMSTQSKPAPIVIDAPYKRPKTPSHHAPQSAKGACAFVEEEEEEMLPEKPVAQNIDTVLPTAKLRDKAVDAMKKYTEQRNLGMKETLNLIIIGHVDSGKSTIMGHILYMKGMVSKRSMHKYEKESKEMKRQSFLYAWVLDDTSEERSRGVTVDIAQQSFETENKSITILDAPGHKDFIPNMITGASRADVSILVVDATMGRFESGFENGGQTREHAILIRSLGVSQLVVAINKMDTVDWSHERFNDIKTTLGRFLKTVGYREKDLTYVPCSGLTGDNLCEKPRIDVLDSWYKGGTLLQAIDNMEPPEREIERPIRFCISNVSKASNSSAWVIGKLHTGYMQTGDKLLLLPNPKIVTVKKIENESGDNGCGFAGDTMSITLSGVDPSALYVGDFLSDSKEPVKLAAAIRARIVIFDVQVAIINGTELDFHYLSVALKVIISKLVSVINKATGVVTKKSPRMLRSNSSAIVDIKLPRTLCMENFQDFKNLGRFSLRKDCETVAVGMVTEILA